MKKLVLALVAVAALCACQKEHTPFNYRGLAFSLSVDQFVDSMIARGFAVDSVASDSGNTVVLANPAEHYRVLAAFKNQQLRNIAEYGPAASSMDKVKKYLVKQYQQAAITNDYWSYIIWHELDDDADFDKDYCKMVEDMKATDVQRMAQRLLEAKRCIEVTMLSE